MDQKITRPAALPEDQALIRGGALDLRMLGRIVRRERVVVLSVLAAFLVLAAVYLHTAETRFAVRMVVTGVASRPQGIGGSLEELSSMAGLDIGGGAGNPHFKLFVSALRSPFAAQAIASDQELLKAMFPREWSEAERRWRQPPSVLRSIARPVFGALGWYQPPYLPPDASRVFDYLRDELKVVPDPKSGAVTLEIDSHHPEVAERVLMTLNNSVDERMRQHDLERATTDIKYLSERLTTVNVEEYRKALVANLVDQEKTRMLASAPLAYVSDVLGRPLVSSRPVSPSPLATFFAALILGSLVSVGVGSFRYYRRC